MVAVIMDFGTVCRVTTECAIDGERFIFYLPGDLLWEVEGMAELFRVCRGYLADPASADDEEDRQRREDVWESFHIVAIETLEGNMPFDRQSYESLAANEALDEVAAPPGKSGDGK